MAATVDFDGSDAYFADDETGSMNDMDIETGDTSIEFIASLENQNQKASTVTVDFDDLSDSGANPKDKPKETHQSKMGDYYGKIGKKGMDTTECFSDSILN